MGAAGGRRRPEEAGGATQTTWRPGNTLEGNREDGEGTERWGSTEELTAHRPVTLRGCNSHTHPQSRFSQGAPLQRPQTQQLMAEI